MTTRASSPPSAGGRRGPYAKSAERRESIVAAAFEVFAAHGYQGGSLQRVADVVGMSQTSLLHYFPSKSDLLLEVLRRRDQMADGRGRDEAARTSFPDGIVAQARYNVGVPGLVGLYAVLSGEAVTEGNPGRDYVSERLAALRLDYADELRALAAEGRLRDGVDPDRAAAALVGLWDGAQLQWLLAPDSVDVAQVLLDWFALVLTPAGEATDDAGARPGRGTGTNEG